MSDAQLAAVKSWLEKDGLGAVILVTPSPLLGGKRERAVTSPSAAALLKAVLQWQLEVSHASSLSEFSSVAGRYS